MFDAIFQNEAFQKFAFGQLRTILEKGNLEMMVLRIDADGGLLVQMFKPGEAVLTVVEPQTAEVVETKLLIETTEQDAAN